MLASYGGSTICFQIKKLIMLFKGWLIINFDSLKNKMTGAYGFY